MEIELEQHEGNDVLIVHLRGDLHETEAISLADRILNVVPSNLPKTLEINLSHCQSVSVQGIGALVSLSLAPELENHSVRIAGQTEEIEAKMRGLKLHHIFEFAPAT
jgi:anti-anti-sigma regulatory factor